MGGPPNYYSPEQDVEIKVQPRQSPYPANLPRHLRPDAPPPPPYQPNIYQKWIPWLVPAIVMVNVVLFVVSMYENNCPATSNRCIGTDILGRFAFQSTRENPLLGPSATTLESMGAMEVKKVVDNHEVWRLASCMWLHAGVFHLFANMLSLLFVGIRLEQEFGFLRIGLLYALSGIGGSLLSSLYVRRTISVGASGALFGLLGAMLSELIVNWTIYENKVEALLTLIVIILINLAVGILPHVDNFAHFGGFVTGFLIGFVILIRPQFGYINQKHAPYGYGPTKRISKYKIYQYCLLVIGLVLLTIGFTTGFLLLLRGVDGNDHCSWCHYLSCMPTPLWSCEARCSSHQIGNQLNLTCLYNSRSQSYLLSSGNTTQQIQQLCVELCR